MFAATVGIGAVALYRDLQTAFLFAGPSNVPASIRRQVEAIERRVPPGQPILLLSATLPDELWYTRLFQRVLYPRNEVLIRYLPLTRADADTLRNGRSIGYAIAFDAEPPDRSFRAVEDLGPLPAMAHRVWVGERTPP